MSGYEDIIDMPYPQTSDHSKMSLHDRAAQFSPFAALTGYNDIIYETARLTDSRPEADEYRTEQINKNLRYIAEHIRDSPKVDVIYFVADERKEGGKYVSASGEIRLIDEFEMVLIFRDGRKISIGDIYEINLRGVN